MAKINDTTTYPNTTPVLADHFPATDVSNTANDVNGETVTFTLQAVMDLFEANFAAPATAISSGTFADARIAASNVTQHQAALTITESQISDLQTYLTAATVEANVDPANLTLADAGGWFTTDNVEAATQELGASVDGIDSRLSTVESGYITASTAPVQYFDAGGSQSAARPDVSTNIVVIWYNTGGLEPTNLGPNDIWQGIPGRPINAQVGTTYTFVLGDAGYLVTSTNASPQTLTVPTNASVAYVTGTEIYVIQGGAGATTITGATGVSINGTSAGSFVIGEQYAGAVLTKTGTDAWFVRLLPTDQTGKGQQHLYIPAAAMISRTTSGAEAATTELATNDVMVESFNFDTAADEHVQFSLQMPKSWDEGTLVAQFIWSHPSTTTNFGVTWAIQAVAFADGDAGDTAFGTAVLVDDTGGTTDDIYISPESGAITVAGTPGAEEYVVFQVYRDVSDANDTLAVDARLHGVKIHWTNNALTAD